MTHEFVHLHVHSHYSLLDATNRFDELAKAVKERRMRSVALTDHGNLFGAIDFYRTTLGQGVKPIIGCEVYVAPESRHERVVRPDGFERGFHLTLLAVSGDGYRNLCKLSSLAFTEGFYYHPRVDEELLDAHAEGLVALSGCLSGIAARRFLSGDEKGAIAGLRRFRDIFGAGNFYVELQNHGLPEQQRLTEFLLERAKADGMPLVATNDVHYLDQEDASVHDALLCVGTRNLIREPNRKRYGSDQFFLKTPDEMHRRFAFAPEALANTLAIAERAELTLEFGKHHLPAFPIPSGSGSESEYFVRLAEEGLRARCPDEPAYRERLARELEVIVKKGFPGYFLIVADFIAEARKKGIPVGPGRGSSAGSLVAFALGITEVDPLKHGLLFERFLNPERQSLPDIDVDICQLAREEVIEYVRQRYGHDRVAQIITFGTFGAKAVLRDVARISDLGIPETERLVKLVPDQLKITLSEAIDTVAELKAAAEGPHRELFRIALKLEGLVRHASRHAAGVVISNVPITEVVPLYRDADGHIITQYDMGAVDALGLLKMDLLGLKTLSVIACASDESCALRPKLTPETVNPYAGMTFDDPEVYRLLSAGHTLGVFQLDSSGIRDLIAKVKPSRFEDIGAILALYRPGAMLRADEFIACKEDPSKVVYPHPSLEEVLEPTYGIILYQEQVMEIAHRMGGFPLSKADDLRKAMGKKKPELMASFRQQFVEGAVANKIPRATAEEIFNQMERFAGYGFNKSHAVAYAVISYHTAWLKAHRPAHFMAATLSFEADDHDKLALYLGECRRMKLAVLPPHVAHSGVHFLPVTDEDGKPAIRFGLAAVKNVGASACEAIVEARASAPFQSFWDFLMRVDRKRLNRRAVEALVLVGALDGLGPNRRSLFESLPLFWERTASELKAAGSEQASLFGEEISEPRIVRLDEFENLARIECEHLGFYLDKHPLAERFPAARFLAPGEMEPGREVAVLGLLSSITVSLDKLGQEMARARLDALNWRGQLLIWGSVFKRRRAVAVEDAVVLVRGRMDQADLVKVDDLVPVDEIDWRARLGLGEADEETLAAAQKLLAELPPGRCEVEIALHRGGKNVRLKLKKKVAIQELVKAIEQRKQITLEEIVPRGNGTTRG